MPRTSPQEIGPVAAPYFNSTAVTPASGTYTQQSLRAIPEKVIVITNGTTEVNVFGTTNPFSGIFLDAKILAKDDLNGDITLQHTSASTVVFTISKGSAGAIKGSYFAATAFTAGATATVKSSGTGNAVVEIDFLPTNPAL